MINVKHLNIDTLTPNKNNFDGSKIIVIGKPGTGKSILIKSLLYAKRHIIKVGIALHGNEIINRAYSEFMNKDNVHYMYNEQALEKFIKRQVLAIRTCKNPTAALIIDDCTEDYSIFTSTLQSALFRKGRWYKMFYILAMHTAADIPSRIRSCVDGVFLLRNPIIKERKIIYENYASIIPSYKLFCELMNVVAQNYTALYIDNTSNSNDWTDCVFWYKAPYPIDPKWKFTKYNK